MNVVDQITPLGKRLLVRRIEPELRIGSIILPEIGVEKPLEGEVLKLGKGRATPRVKSKKSPTRGFMVPVPQRFGPDVEGTFNVKVGDEVLLNKEEIRANKASLCFCSDESLLIVDESWVLGVIE